MAVLGGAPRSNAAGAEPWGKWEACQAGIADSLGKQKILPAFSACKVLRIISHRSEQFLGRFCNVTVYCALVMATTTKRTRFSRRLPDHVTDELVIVLSEKKVFGFNDLFERVFDNLKLRNAVSGGEEMLRLRAYEKLQNLVTRGLVEKIGKEYKGTARVHEASSAYAAAQEEAREG
jgi:hypothetical protein